jgi:hypothetical protein
MADGDVRTTVTFPNDRSNHCVSQDSWGGRRLNSNETSHTTWTTRCGGDMEGHESGGIPTVGCAKLEEIERKNGDLRAAAGGCSACLSRSLELTFSLVVII